MPSIEERLEAGTHTLELVAHSQDRTEKVVNALAESQAASDRRLDRIERIMGRPASMTLDHEQRLNDLEED